MYNILEQFIFGSSFDFALINQVYPVLDASHFLLSKVLEWQNSRFKFELEATEILSRDNYFVDRTVGKIELVNNENCLLRVSKKKNCIKNCNKQSSLLSFNVSATQQKHFFCKIELVMIEFQLARKTISEHMKGYIYFLNRRAAS